MLRIYRADRSEELAGGLARLLAEPLPDPFAREIIAVPAKGVERWINQNIAETLGIAANIDYPSPTALVQEAIAAATGVNAKTDPWSPDRLAWTVLRAIDATIDEDWNAALRRHLSDDHRPGRRYATAAHLAGLFSSYSSQRPDMLVSWASGDAVVDPDLQWQVHLFRYVRTLIGPCPAERLGRACERIRADPSLVEFPSRLSIFGPTRLATDQIKILDALSAHREVHVWLPHPSRAMWQTLRGRTAEVRSTDETALDLVHPLLMSLGHSVREMQLQLSRETQEVLDEALGDSAPPPETLLEKLQDDIRKDESPGRFVDDGTITVHSCHGPTRQVEVLRERLLHLFEADVSLQPRDVLVMCPDVETYAPLIRAALGQGSGRHPAHGLRVSLADRSLHQTNPVLAVVSQMLAIANSRVTASEVLDLADSAPVRRMFGFDDDSISRLREWVAASGARWGLTLQQRRSFGLGAYGHNTFERALDRVLLGVATDESEGRWLGMALPLDVESNDVDLAGRFSEMIDRLAVCVEALEQVQSASAWMEALNGAIDRLTDVSHDDQWQLTEARRELAAAIDGGGDVVLRLADVRAMLRQRLAGRPTRSNFRTGELTVCTMVPMRSVPHKVVALLGLDDTSFPRVGGVDGDDALAREPRVGERDVRTEDRQLLLDAVMAARGHLILLYTGRDPVSGKERPPAVPLGELIDVVKAMTGDDKFVKSEPLQPFDPRNFLAPKPFSFDADALLGALAKQQPQQEPEPFLSGVLPASVVDDIELQHLIDFCTHPIKAFLRQRLGISVEEFNTDISDAMPVKLDGLESWKIGDRLLKARLAGVEAMDFWHAETRRGTLPVAEIGKAVCNELNRKVEEIVERSGKAFLGPAETHDVAVDVGDGIRVIGTVPDVRGSMITRAFYSRLAAKHRMTAWVELLALAATTPGNWRAASIGRGQRKPLRSVLDVPADPLATLRDLIALREEGLQRPLKLPPNSTLHVAEALATNAALVQALNGANYSCWSGDFGERLDKSIVWCFGDHYELKNFVDDDFGTLAGRLWSPLLESEQTS